MSHAFYVTFWVSIIVLLIIAVIYSFSASTSIGEFEEADTSARMAEARDSLVWTLILQSIALALLVILLIYGFAFKWHAVYDRPPCVFLLYSFFFVWFVAALIPLVIAYERVGASVEILTSTTIQHAKRDLGVAIASVGAIGILLLIGYFGYVYRYETLRHLTFEKCMRAQ